MKLKKAFFIVLKKFILFIVITYLCSVVQCASSKVYIVKIPCTKHLNTDKYKIQKIDTVSTIPCITKIHYLER